MTVKHRGRIYRLDWLKAMAILMMVFFHLLYDLDLFGIIKITKNAYFVAWGGLIGGLFFFCVGSNLYYAHHLGMRWLHFFTRLCRILLGAILVSIATFYAMPNAWVFLGVLHGIVLVSLLSLPFIFKPAFALITGCFILIMGLFFDLPNLSFLLLNHYLPLPSTTLDFYPPLPWLGFSLIGIGCAKYKLYLQQTPALPPAFIRWMSQHSLLIYLVHQLILYPLIYALHQLLMA